MLLLLAAAVAVMGVLLARQVTLVHLTGPLYYLQEVVQAAAPSVTRQVELAADLHYREVVQAAKIEVLAVMALVEQVQADIVVLVVLTVLRLLVDLQPSVVVVAVAVRITTLVVEVPVVVVLAYLAKALMAQPVR
jgi:hypothetical protein